MSRCRVSSPAVTLGLVRPASPSRRRFGESGGRKRNRARAATFSAHRRVPCGARPTDVKPSLPSCSPRAKPDSPLTAQPWYGADGGRRKRATLNSDWRSVRVVTRIRAKSRPASKLGCSSLSLKPQDRSIAVGARGPVARSDRRLGGAHPPRPTTSPNGCWCVPCVIATCSDAGWRRRDR
jgi:hypothetical protein